MRQLLTLIALVFAASVHAASVTLNPVADAFLSANNPNSNYGGAGSLGVSAAGLSKGEFDSLLRFDLSAAKASFDSLLGVGLWTIQSITLTLNATPPNNAIFNGFGEGPGGSNVNFAGQFALRWIVNDSWVEGTGTPIAPSPAGITFNGLPGIVSGSDEALGTYSFNGVTSGTTAYNLPLTTGFSADATAGNLVSFLATPADANIAMLVNSRSVGAAMRPMLTVVAVPEPNSAALMAVAILAVGSLRRRRVK